MSSYKPTLEELFNPLIRKYTEFNSVIDFLAAGGFNVKTQEDLDGIDRAKLDEYIKKTQPGLHNWDNMLYGALKLYGKEHRDNLS
jgi:hypothetical protein